MFSEKKFVITIGTHGALVCLHEKKSVESQIFLPEFNDAAKEELKTLFKKNKSAPVYILLDTLDQSYKKKIYPAVTKPDLHHLVLRDMLSDSDKESFKNYIILNPKKQRKDKWDCLFVSASKSEVINSWIEFIMNDQENRLVGIYMLPVEVFSLFNLVKSKVEAASKSQDKKNDLYCFILQDKVSGTRQIVFSNSGIVFTRAVNYDFDQDDFIKKYEQDIRSTFEYLKRLFPDLLISQLNIVNILSDAVLTKIKNSNSNSEISFSYYTLPQIATEIASLDINQQDDGLCDLLISRVFFKSKKNLKFSTPKINAIEKLFFALQATYAANLFLLLTTITISLYTIFSQDKVGEMVDMADAAKLSAVQEFNKVKTLAFNGEAINDEEGNAVELERVMDFGKIDETLGGVSINFSDLYSKFSFLKNYSVKLKGFNYSLTNFISKSPSSSGNYSLTVSGDIFNKSGDIEDLFKGIDDVTSELRKNFTNSKIKSPDLPKNIDFNQKYYNFQIDFTITKGS